MSSHVTNGPTSVTADMLRDLPFCAGLTDEQLAAIAAIARVESVDSGEVLLRQGQPADELRVVLEGKFSLCLELPGGDEQCLMTATRGEVLGWSALLEQTTWLATATALKPSAVLVLRGQELRALCEANHEVGYRVMKNLFAAVTARLHDTRMQLIDMYAHG